MDARPLRGESILQTKDGRPQQGEGPICQNTRIS